MEDDRRRDERVDERDEALQVDRAHLRPADVLGDQRSSDGVISANATAITASATKTTNATPSSLLRAFGAIERCVAFEPKSASVIRSRALRTVAIRFSDLAFFSDFFTASRPSLYSSSAASSAAASASASARSASANRMIALTLGWRPRPARRVVEPDVGGRRA